MHINPRVFESYLSGEMPDPEKKEFENLLQSDATTQESFNHYRLSQTHIAAASDRRLKNKLDEIGNDLFDQEDATYNNSRPLYYKMAVAAAVLVLMVLSGSYFYQNYLGVDSTEELFMAYYEPLPADNFTTRSSEAEGLAEWIEAMNFYRKGNFEQAAQIFESLASDTTFDLQTPAMLYGGISFLEINAPDKAIALLTQISQNSLAAQEANWYIAMSYLQLEEVSEAVARIRQIAENPDHYKVREATELLDKLKALAQNSN